MWINFRNSAIDRYNPLDYNQSMQTIVELPEFQRKADKILSESQKLSIINYLASHPAAGDVMQGTGGIRKLRWSAQGKGKSGGARVIYYYHNDSVPLFLLTIFGKGEKSNVSINERNELANMTSLIIKHYGDTK